MPILVSSTAAVKAPDHEPIHEYIQRSQNRERSYHVRLFVAGAKQNAIARKVSVYVLEISTVEFEYHVQAAVVSETTSTIMAKLCASTQVSSGVGVVG